VQIAFRQSQVLAKRAGMVDDAENGAMRAMAAEAAAAPVARAAGQVDLAGDAAADPRGRIRLDHFAHELMAGRAGEAVVTALEFEIGIADAAAKQADQGEARGPAGARLIAYFDASVFQVYGQHGLFQTRAIAEPQDGIEKLLQLRTRASGDGKIIVA
jgi:hypothetical protein